MKKLIFFGAGEFGLRWLNKLGKDEVYAFADFDLSKTGTELQGKRVLSIEELCSLKDEKVIFISTSDKYKREIQEALIKYEQQDYIVDTPYWKSGNYIDISASVDQSSFLEGKNVILGNTNIISSYLGYASYVSTYSSIINMKIGKYCAIGPKVRVIRGQHPTKKFVSIYPGFYSTNNQGARVVFTDENLFEEYRYAEYPYSISIGNDVWVGEGANIMEGVVIADGTIIAAGAMVVKDTEEYTIVGGVPAKKIGERFAKDEKEFLMKLKWWEKSEEWLKKYARYFRDITLLKQELENV